MKIKRIIAAIATAVMLLPLTGCQLAKAASAVGNAPDRLIGVLVTNDHLDLFDMEGYLNENINSFSGGEITMSGNTKKYEGRLYATLTTKELTNTESGEKVSVEEYAFDSVKGISFFTAKMPPKDSEEGYTSSVFADGISDSHFAINCGDDEDKNTLEGTIYLVPGKSGSTHYINPVYQSGDGRVYAISGQGISIGGVQSEGSVYSQKLEESVTITENGKSKKQTTVVNVSIQSKLPPQKIVVLEMDKNNSCLSRQEFMPGKVPESITPNSHTEYILLESYKKGFDGKEKIERTLFSPDQEYLESFFANEDGVVIKQSTTLNWNPASRSF